MANRDRREALRGAEEEMLDLLAQVLTSEQWAELLEAPRKRAATTGHSDLAQKLAGPNRDGREALRGAEEETFDLLADMLTSEQWADLLKPPLEHAAFKGHRDLAQKLVGAGAEIGNALNEAVWGDHEEIVNDLLENGASVDAKDKCGRTPLLVASQEGKPEVVELLLLNGADKDAMDDMGYTPLTMAISSGHVAVMLALMAAGADVNFRGDGPKPSVVHLAAVHGHVDVMRVAIERGADVDAADEDQCTPLHRAAALHDKAEAIDVLVGAGANIEARDRRGCTPLHVAATVASPASLLALLKHGAHVNARDGILGETPLHWAAATVYPQAAAKVVDSLLRYGADETILNERGSAAVDMVGIVSEDDGSEDEDNNQLREDVDRLRRLLANAPVDRAWRRKGYLVLCRTHPDRLQQIQQDTGSEHAGTARMTRGGATQGSTLTSGCSGVVGDSPVDDRGGGDWAVVVERVLGLQEEGVFRTIVGYL